MPLATGTVEAVSLKPLNAPDQYENTHRMSVKIGDDWFSFGSTKGSSYVNKNVTNLSKGDVVELMYDQNGDFKNVKRATVQVTSSAPKQGSSSSGTGQAGKQQGSTYSGVNPAEVGQCLNLAVQLGVAKSYDELSKPSVMATAITLYKNVKKQYTDNWDKAEATKATAEAPENTGPTDLDDDIPF